MEKRLTPAGIPAPRISQAPTRPEADSDEINSDLSSGGRWGKISSHGQGLTCGGLHVVRLDRQHDPHARLRLAHSGGPCPRQAEYPMLPWRSS